MRKVFMLMTTALFSFEAWAQTEECVEAPSCTELGYTRTEDECPTGSVKCPWNTGLVYCECGEDYKYACDGDNEKAGDSQCNGLYAACSCADGYKWENGGCVADRPKCNIGDIFYTDNTCVAADKHDSSKTVLGIVVYVNDNGVGGQIMAPWFVDQNGNKSTSGVEIKWSTEEIDVPGLPNITRDTQAGTDFSSCENTNKIVTFGNTDEYIAAWAAWKYAPTEATKDQWCLPAAGVLRNIQENLSVIDMAVRKAGGTGIENYWVWSSSEGLISSVWYALLGNDYLDMYNKGFDAYVRPVLEF